MKAALLVLILLAPAFAGCTDSRDGIAEASPGSSDEPASSVTVEPEPGVRVAENRGALKGRVLNDQSLPINGALVTLAQSSYFAKTNASGSFLITNIVPGEYNVRAERAGFAAEEVQVLIEAANVTVVDLALAPVDDGRSADRPHVHDFWGEEAEVVLMDGDVDLTQDPGGGYGAVPWPILSRLYYPNSNQTNPPGWPFFLPDSGTGGRPSIILPGTGRLVTIFTWSQSDVTIPKLSLAYRHATETKAMTAMLPPVSSGTPQVVEVNATTADTGHQTFSLWQFWIHSGNAATSSGYSPGFVNGKVHVKMVLVKAEVFLEPEHPDRWAGADSLLLRNKTKVYRLPAGSLPAVSRDPYDAMKLDEGKIVPPEANKMRIEMTWTYPQDAGPLNFEHDLVWRTGDQPPGRTLWSQFRTVPAKETVLGVNGKKVWEFDLDPMWTDTFYQRASNWVFMIKLEPQTDEVQHVEPRTHDVRLDITVWKDPAYA